MRTTNNTQTIAEQLEHVAGLYSRYAGSIVKHILAEFVVIPRADLPEVSMTSRRSIRAGEETEYVDDATEEMLRGAVLETVAIWEYIKSGEASRAAAVAKRDVRRDELAGEFSGVSNHKCYVEDSPILKAIDRIIELEEAAS